MNSANRWLHLPIPFAAQLLLRHLYEPINEEWTVVNFGCGCPRLDGTTGFNANHFNLILWSIIFLLLTTWLVRLCVIVYPEVRYWLLLSGLPVLLMLCLKAYAEGYWL